MWGIQAERTVSVPSMRMSESCSELLVLAIFFRKSGRSSYVCELKVGSSISAVSAMSAISALFEVADLWVISALGLGADIVDLADIADLGAVEVTMEIPASLAFWKKVLMVTPVPWAWRQRSYCLSVSAWS